MAYLFKRREQSYPVTLYAIFDLPPAATQDELSQRFRLLAADWHPDNPSGGDEERYKQLSESWQTLKDSAQRSEYNQRLRREGNLCDNCDGEGVRYSNIDSFRAADLARATRTICAYCEGTGQKPVITQRPLGMRAGRIV